MLRHVKPSRKAAPAERHGKYGPQCVMEKRHGKRHGMCDVMTVKSLVWCKKIKACGHLSSHNLGVHFVMIFADTASFC